MDVSRTSRYGNPFRSEDVGGNAEAVALFERWIAGEDFPGVNRPRPSIDDLKRLRGRDLACYCRQDQPCHADSLLRIAAGLEEPQPV